MKKPTRRKTPPRRQARIRTITSVAMFDQEVDGSDVPVMCYLGSKWCEPCQELWPHLQKISAEYNNKLKVIKVDVDQLGELADELEIEAVPTLLWLENGEIVDEMEGFDDEADLRSLIEDNLKAS